jgi:hypothetical protein
MLNRRKLKALRHLLGQGVWEQLRNGNKPDSCLSTAEHTSAQLRRARNGTWTTVRVTREVPDSSFGSEVGELVSALSNRLKAFGAHRLPEPGCSGASVLLELLSRLDPDDLRLGSDKQFPYILVLPCRCQKES